MGRKCIYICDSYGDYEFNTKRIWRTDGKYEPFVYLIQEVETDMLYIGSKTQYVDKPCLESWLGTKYFTSSNEFDWESDLDSFEICKIIPCASNHDALILEGKLIEQNGAVWDDSYYNKSHPYIGFNRSGAIISIELRAKMSKSRKGRILSDDHKRKISLSVRGEKNPFYGKFHNIKAKNKISKANKGRLSGENNPHSKMKGELSPHYGKQKSVDHKQKLTKCRNTIKTSQVSCIKCRTSGEYRSLKHYHFENCGIKEHHNSGTRNGMAKTIYVFNAFGFLVYEFKGNFTKKSKEIGLPHKPLISSYKNDGKPISLTQRSKNVAKRNNKECFIGWYAIAI